MPDARWQEYYEQTKGAKPRPLLVKALGFVKDRNEALDLGSGALNDAKYLITEGFRHVTAVDCEPLAQEIAGFFPKDRFSYVISSFDGFDFQKGMYDMVSAQYSLPFNSRTSFGRVFASIVSSLKDGGVLAGQLFGDRDEWNTSGSDMTFHTKTEVESLLAMLHIAEFFEEEKDGMTAAGSMKHWHVFHFIAIK